MSFTSLRVRKYRLLFWQTRAQASAGTRNQANLVSIAKSAKEYGEFWTELHKSDNGRVDPSLEFHVIPEVRSATFFVLMKMIEFKIVERSLLKQKATADMGLDSILYDPTGANRGLWTDGNSDTTRLNFFGEVTLVPSVGAFVLGVWDSTTIYLKSTLPKSGPIFGFFCPAFLVKLVDVNLDTSQIIGDTHMTLKWNKLEFEFSHSESFITTVSTSKVAASLPDLRQ